MNLAHSRMDCLRGCLSTLSVLVVRISLLEYSMIHEKPYKFIVCAFKMYYVMRASAPSLLRESTHSLMYRQYAEIFFFTFSHVLAVENDTVKPEYFSLIISGGENGFKSSGGIPSIDIEFYNDRVSMGTN